MGKDDKKYSPPVSKDELNFRKDQFPAIKSVVNTNPLCTSCNQSLKMNIINGKAFVHPFLGTLLCEKCHTFYGDGDFSVDEDGSDKYCRWCGQGGTIFQCSTCPAGFCKKCIKRNLSRSILDEVEGDEWKCFCCDIKPLYPLRALAWAAVEHANAIEKRAMAKKRSRRNSDSDSETPPHPAKKVRNRLFQTAYSSHFKEISHKLTSFIGDMVNLSQRIKSNSDVTKSKCRKKSINSLESIDEATQGIITLIEMTEKDVFCIKEKVHDFQEEWKRTVNEINRKQLESDSTNSETTESYESSSKTEKEEAKSEDSEVSSKKEESANEGSLPVNNKDEELKDTDLPEENTNGEEKGDTQEPELSTESNEIEDLQRSNLETSENGNSRTEELSPIAVNGEVAEKSKSESEKRNSLCNEISEQKLTEKEKVAANAPAEESSIVCQED